MSIGQMLRLEWSKWSGNAVFRTMSLMYFLMAPFLIFIGKRLSDMPPLPSPKMIFRFPDVWDFMGYSGSWLAFFCLGFFAVYMVTSEIGWKTMRQGVLNGQTRAEFFLGKFMFVLLYAGITAVYFFLSASLVGWFHTEGASLEKLLDNDLSVLRYFLMVLAYMSFGLLVGFGIRKSGLALFVYFAYILFVESIIRWAVHLKFFPGSSQFYYPMNVVEDLQGNPMMKFATNLKVTANGEDSPLYVLSTSESATYAAVYILIFLVSAWLLLKKRDI